MALNAAKNASNDAPLRLLGSGFDCGNFHRQRSDLRLARGREQALDHFRDTVLRTHDHHTTKHATGEWALQHTHQTRCADDARRTGTRAAVSGSVRNATSTSSDVAAVKACMAWRYGTHTNRRVTVRKRALLTANKGRRTDHV